MSSRFGVLLLAAALAGCGSAPPLPDDVYYRLQLAAPAQRLEAPRVAGAVLVARFGGASVYTSRDLAYSSESPYLHLSHYHYHHWVDPPPQLLQQELVDYLRAANLASRVETEAGRQPPAWRIDGTIRRFERQKTASGWQVAVALEFRATPADRRAEPMLKSYDVILAAEGDGIEATVKAFSAATATVFERFLADLGKAVPAAR
jgi:ABC-type uncharacterized transport system auxiliary subunit